MSKNNALSTGYAGNVTSPKQEVLDMLSIMQDIWLSLAQGRGLSDTVCISLRLPISCSAITRR
jgi:hypothetical protein